MENERLNKIKELHKKTKANIIDCRTALIESNGNMKVAIQFLDRKGLIPQNANKFRKKLISTLQTIGFILFLFSAIAPGVIISIAPELDVFPLQQWLLISLAGAAVSMLMMTRSISWLLSGLIFSASTFFLYWMYFFKLFGTRGTFIKLEFSVPVLLALPIGFGALWLFQKIFKPENQPQKQ